jgi:hypothetical protein
MPGLSHHFPEILSGTTDSHPRDTRAGRCLARRASSPFWTISMAPSMPITTSYRWAPWWAGACAASWALVVESPLARLAV